MIDERCFRWLSPIEKYIMKKAFMESWHKICVSGEYTKQESDVHTRILNEISLSIQKYDND